MKLCVAYTCVSLGPITGDYCARFVATWHEYPPGVETDLLVICNGGALRTELALIFSCLRSQMFPRGNDAGFDLTGYLEAAKGPLRNYDAVLFCGESIYFHREGWLRRFVEAWGKYGEGFYGPFSSNNVRAHLNTSAFFTSPAILLSYPCRTFNGRDRYEMEHGTGALWRRVAHRGFPVRLVTWDGEYDPFHWRQAPNILWRGNQSNLLMLCNHSERWATTTPQNRAEWSARADQPFQ